MSHPKCVHGLSARQVGALIDLLEDLFDPNWATTSPSNRKEAVLHRKVARVLVDHGLIGKAWDQWLTDHEVGLDITSQSW